MNTCSYAMGLLKNVNVGEDINEYVRCIDETLEPFEGRFLIHGGQGDVVEGELDSDVIVIEFPTPEGASAWYRSSAYQEIIALRTRNSDGVIALLPGVSANHRAWEIFD